MANGPEDLVERHLRRRVVAEGGLCFKMPAGVYAGIPDRLVLLPWGQIWFVELKAAKGRVRPTQKVWHDRAARIGVPVAILDSIEAVDAWMQDRLDS